MKKLSVFPKDKITKTAREKTSNVLETFAFARRLGKPQKRAKPKQG
jgi:hypothetical protein